MPGSRSERLGSTRSPSMKRSPELGVRMQPMIDSRVVLPEPDGPSSAVTSPGSSESDTPLSTFTTSRPSLNDFRISFACSTGIGHLSSSEDECRNDRCALPEVDERGTKAHRNHPAEKTDSERSGHD